MGNSNNGDVSADQQFKNSNTAIISLFIVIECQEKTSIRIRLDRQINQPYTTETKHRHAFYSAPEVVFRCQHNPRK